MATDAPAAEPVRFEWKDGDRVVLVGDTLIERDQSYGYFETLVTAANPDKTIVFRNLGWSADTPLGLARAAFDPPEAGFRRLKEHVLALKPTVLVIGYGMAASFDGEAGLPAFVAGLNTLLDALGPLQARFVFLSPIAHEDRGRPLPDPSNHNRDLERYRDAIRKLAEERHAWFVDLYEPTLSAHDYGIDPLTDDGIHPTTYGSWYLASVIDLELRQVKRDQGWNVRVAPGGRVSKPSAVRVAGVEAMPDRIRFEVTDPALPMPLAPPGAPEAVIWMGGKRTLRFAGLAPGRYTLSIDGRPAATSDADTWASGVALTAGPEFDQAEALRKAINEKNRLYFYRWRPQNETYLFGFRKHEQGNNAREIPLFDPLVGEKENEIARLRKPVPHVYELKRESEVSQ
jgi:hypothetical protein